jgi:nucleotide-binding universal stress UspA family protein
MEQMGEFILLSAQASAHELGVSAEGVIRHGTVRDEIIWLAQEVGADYVVLGRPKARQEENVFTEELLRDFIERIEEEAACRVILAEEGADG